MAVQLVLLPAPGHGPGEPQERRTAALPTGLLTDSGSGLSAFEHHRSLSLAAQFQWRTAGTHPAYQTIIDIAPIAAPASAGSALEGVYGYFTSYQRRMVSELSGGSGDTRLPMVAFGAPVRSWITQQYGVNLPVLGPAR